MIALQEEEDLPSGPCQGCGRRPATHWWTGDGGVLGHIHRHGFKSAWCEACVLETQLAHARKMAASIPELEQKLQAFQQREQASTGRQIHASCGGEVSAFRNGFVCKNCGREFEFKPKPNP